jgi:hypothetical protein
MREHAGYRRRRRYGFYAVALVACVIGGCAGGGHLDSARSTSEIVAKLHRNGFGCDQPTPTPLPRAKSVVCGVAGSGPEDTEITVWEKGEPAANLARLLCPGIKAGGAAAIADAQFVAGGNWSIWILPQESVSAIAKATGGRVTLFSCKE